MKKLICPLTSRPITQADFHLKNTLVNGQAFNWKELKSSSSSSSNGVLYRGIIFNRIVDFTVNASDEILYRGYPDSNELPQLLEDYLQLRVNVKALSENWAKNDTHYSRVYARLKGVRVLRQDPFECMISFICSSNNNIPRITKILASIRAKYGKQIHLSPQDAEALNNAINQESTNALPKATNTSTIEEDSEGDSVSETEEVNKHSQKQLSEQMYFGFPTIESLLKASESELREIGLGYRADYIASTVASLNDLGGEKHLHALRKLEDPADVTKALKEFKGIGQKVADCIALFSLDAKNLIPVDTHVFQIYERVYKNRKTGGGGASAAKDKKMNPAKYAEVTEFFKKKFGDYAGWAQQCIFAAELPQFQDAITAPIPSTTGAAVSKSQKQQQQKSDENDVKNEKKIQSKQLIIEKVAKSSSENISAISNISVSRKTRSSGVILPVTTRNQKGESTISSSKNRKPTK